MKRRSRLPSLSEAVRRVRNALKRRLFAEIRLRAARDALRAARQDLASVCRKRTTRAR